MGTDPSTIRKDIEETRERMGETVDALAYKSDVGARTKDAVHDRVDSVKQKLGVAGDRLSTAQGTAQDALPGTDDVAAQARRAKGLAQENPLGLAIGAVAVGFVAGLLIPNTRAENQRLAPVANQLTEHAQEAAQVAMEHGKEAAQEVAGAAQEAVGQVAETARGAAQDVAERAKDTGQEHAQGAKGDLADTAQDARQAVADRT